MFIAFFCATRNATDNDDVKSELKRVDQNGRAESVLLLEVQYRALQHIEAHWVPLSLAGVTGNLYSVLTAWLCGGWDLGPPFCMLTHWKVTSTTYVFTDASVVTTATHADGPVICRHTNPIWPLANNRASSLSLKMWFEKQMICLQS